MATTEFPKEILKQMVDYQKRCLEKSPWGSKDTVYDWWSYDSDPKPRRKTLPEQVKDFVSDNECICGSKIAAKEFG